ncbi:MAG: hypothetical protein HFG22_05870 [Lachnospiraceae bacterium]|nr:hypothetical protein [Lachnospiraceae bacterium]
MERLFNAYLGRTIGIRDTFVWRPLKENLPSGKATTKGPKRQDPSVCFYHGILLGILGFKSGWYVRSNKEAGNGYRDIQIQVEDADIGIIIEVKYAEDGDYDTVCQKALEQIEAGDYAAELAADGLQRILRYGIVCYKKRCKVLMAKR